MNTHSSRFCVRLRPLVLLLSAFLGTSSAFASTFLCGESVVETFDSSRRILRVDAIAANGLLVLSDGVAYNEQYVQHLLSSLNGISVGDRVVEVYDSSRSVLTVQAIAADSNFLLSNGTWYNSSYIRTLLGRANGISIGDTVVEAYDSSRSILTVRQISNDGTYLLSNGTWYALSFLRTLRSVDNGYSIGQRVVETYDSSRSILTVQVITSDHLVLLSNGTWYAMNYLQPLLSRLNGISIGDAVVETYDSNRSTLTVQAISKDGDYLLSNGIWYNAQYIRTLLAAWNGISVGDEVLETYDSSPQRHRVVEIASDGIYLLDNGIWYSTSYVQRLVCDHGNCG